MHLIDTDNAAGSPKGDVDDAFALAALFRSGLPIAAVTAVAGNTSKELAERNNRALGALCGYSGPWDADGIRGPLRFVALGPLTNLAAALGAAVLGKIEITEAILVGGNLSSRGRFPPWWPHEFNLTKDREATRAVFASDLPLTIVPLDVARRLRIGPRELQEWQGELGSFLRRHAARWSRRSLLLRGSRRFPVFDLAAAAYLIDPSLVTLGETSAYLHANLWLEFGRGGKQIKIVRDLDPAGIWRLFANLLSEPRPLQ
ncbi:MAG TPA: nucleoside hydrolase [Thermoanaerobaculia bacterium]|jgi:inosine-uridine nucleoside N-ribohydrolase|nr:nucleoside hydrolase [Thermoanaerobaculia bacterium]